MLSQVCAIDTSEFNNTAKGAYLGHLRELSWRPKTILANEPPDYSFSMSSHRPSWSSQIGSAFRRINSSTGIPSIMGGRRTRVIFPLTNTVRNSCCRFLLAAFSAGVNFRFGFVISKKGEPRPILMLSLPPPRHVRLLFCSNPVPPLSLRLGDLALTEARVFR